MKVDAPPPRKDEEEGKMLGGINIRIEVKLHSEDATYGSRAMEHIHRNSSTVCYSTMGAHTLSVGGPSRD